MNHCSVLFDILILVFEVNNENPLEEVLTVFHCTVSIIYLIV